MKALILGEFIRFYFFALWHGLGLKKDLTRLWQLKIKSPAIPTALTKELNLILKAA